MVFSVLVSCQQNESKKTLVELGSTNEFIADSATVIKNRETPYIQDTFNQEIELDSHSLRINQTFLPKRLTLTSKFKNNHFEGDFFGDDTTDLAALVQDGENVWLCIINNMDSSDYLLYSSNQNPTDFGWAGIFKKVNAGDTLWSNYADDFLAFSEVPDSEKVVLTYDAIYAHVQEACGGGFIYWKDGKFNWLQQE
jgi:hypothetical protein